MKIDKRFQLVVIGGSAGSSELTADMLKSLPADFGLPVVIVKHISPDFSNSHFHIESLDKICKLTVKEADQGEMVIPGVVYMAPPNYHLLIEKDRTFSLTIDERVKFCRPAIDILFETAAEAYGNRLIGILLSGANDDGAAGLKRIKKHGGYAIVQDPGTAAFTAMPQAAINACKADAILSPEEIAELLTTLADQTQT